MLVPDKASLTAIRACSALVQAMRAGSYCALVRYVARSAVQLCCLTPLQGKPSIQALLLELASALAQAAVCCRIYGAVQLCLTVYNKHFSLPLRQAP